MPICSCADVELFYRVDGEGPPLMLISGLSSGTWSWYGQVPFFKRHYTTISFDNRGAGRSSMPQGPYTMKQFAEDGLCLLDHLGIDRTFVLALSMGGMIAQELAILAPDRIRAIVLGCTHLGGNVRIPPSERALQLLLNNTGLSQEEIVRKNLSLFFSEECLKNRPEVVEAYVRAQIEIPIQPEHAFYSQLSAIAAFDCSSRLSELAVPTLIVTGTRDTLVPQENAHLLAKYLKNSEVVEIADAGHALHAECREVLNDLAHGFFQKHLS